MDSKKFIVSISEKIYKQTKKIPKTELEKIYKFFEDLKISGLNNSNIIPVEGLTDFYRKRIGDYRVIFHHQLDTNQFIIFAVGRRGDVYRDFKQSL